MEPERIGRYEIRRRLGTGGMASVHLAYDPSLDRLVAIKILRNDDEELRARFTREARAIAKLPNHPNIVMVFDVGEDDGRPFMAMEYVDGDTLTKVLRRTPPDPLRERVSLIEGLCSGLARAHSEGIIHRDIKPDNLMVDRQRVLKILDFGIARLAESGMTQDGDMLGSMPYMSPEQIKGRAVDARTDVFAAGAVLYEAAVLQRPFPGAGVDVLHEILHKGHVPLRERVPEVPRDLGEIVERALRRDAADRYQSVALMGQDLARVLREWFDPSSEGTIVRPRLPRPRLEPERVEEIRRQQVIEHLRSAEDAYADDQYEAALQFAERAIAIDHDSQAAIEQLDKARLALERLRIRALLAEVDENLSRGDLGGATAALAQAPVDDAVTDEALRLEIQDRRHAVMETAARRDKIDALWHRAQTSFEAGDFAEAIAAATNIIELDPNRAGVRTLVRRASAQLDAERQHEQALDVAREALESARILADKARFDEAAALLQGIASPTDTIRQATIDALAEVRALQQRASAAATLAAARDLFDQGELEQALDSLRSVPASAKLERESLRDEILAALRQRRQLEAKRRSLESALDAYQAAIQEGRLEEARSHLVDATRIGSADDRIEVFRQHLEPLEAAAEVERRKREAARTATELIASARARFDRGDALGAISLLERDTSGHLTIAPALAEFRAKLEEQRCREEADRAAAEVADAALTIHARGDAAAALVKLEEGDSGHPTIVNTRANIRQQLAQAEALRQRQEAERAAVEAQRHRQEAERIAAAVKTCEKADNERTETERRQPESRQQEGSDLVERARRQLSTGQLNLALASVESALRLDPDQRAARRLRSDIARESERRRLEEETRVAATADAATVAVTARNEQPADVGQKSQGDMAWQSRPVLLGLAAVLALVAIGLGISWSRGPAETLPAQANRTGSENSGIPDPGPTSTPTPQTQPQDSPLAGRPDVVTEPTTGTQVPEGANSQGPIPAGQSQTGETPSQPTPTQGPGLPPPGDDLDSIRRAREAAERATAERAAADRASAERAATERAAAERAAAERESAERAAAERTAAEKLAAERAAAEKLGADRTAVDRVAILRTLRGYENAWARLDPNALRRVQALSAENLAIVRRSMADSRAITVTVQVQNVTLNPNGRQATVVAQIQRAIVPKGAKATTVSTVSTLDLEKQGDDWVIVALRYPVVGSR